ncbi:MAG: electron transport complex subunit RsxC [Gammaproteobacteria bacterium]|nr:electron transport complex subunit RsxC [Gammaproteobacteria bacterium]MDX5374878.1 electron transport complex subunit RsxC [Gammaproteobacteria bacterium]
MHERAPHLWHFHGGLRLEGHKDLSTREPILDMRIPRWIILPVQQHIGEPAEVLVKPGDHVKKGQLVARAGGYISAPVHASTSGVVAAVEERPVPHPSGLSAPCVVIETDGRDEWLADRMPALPDYAGLDAVTLRNRVREAGIVGLGGAAFPASVKLNPPPGRRIETLIINGAECEPYITCDDMLMREQAQAVIEGIRIIQRIVQAERCLIGIEDNKPEAIAAMREALGEDDVIAIVQIPTRYPTGGEKQLIKVLTNREVPSNGLPSDIGIVCHNVGTAAAVYRAVAHGIPLVSRLVTVTGQGVQHPRNIEVLVGTPISEVVAFTGGYSEAVERLIMGGPMMGFALGDDEVPVIKGTNCILAAGRGEVDRPGPAMPCIRCGECQRACPALLLPQQLYWHAHARDFDKVQDFALFDCIECGCCSYVCPSNIPLVQYFRFAKTEIWEQEREKRKADIARQRHEFRQERLEREEREKAERLAKKKAALAKTAEDGEAEDPKKAAIKAALERAKAKKAATGAAPKNTDNLTEAQQRQIEEAEARRSAARADRNTSDEKDA